MTERGPGDSSTSTSSLFATPTPSVPSNLVPREGDLDVSPVSPSCEDNMDVDNNITVVHYVWG